MKNSVINIAKSKKRREAVLFRNMRQRVVSAIDNSLVNTVARFIRRYVPNLRARAIGTFMATFGVYSALISAFKYVFSFGSTVDEILFSAFVIIVSIPFILSESKVSKIFSGSYTGSVISEYIGIRADAIYESEPVGRANIAFLIGTFCGAATLAVSPLHIAVGIIAVICFSVIMVYPEASVVIAAAVLPFKGELLPLLLGVGTVSLVVKVFRGKRSISFAFHDKVLVALFVFIFVVVIIGGGANYVVLMLSAFLLSLPKGADRRTTGATAALVASCGLAAALHVGFALCFMIGHKTLSFAAASAQVGLFDLKELALLCAAVIPLSVSHTVRGTTLSTLTSVLCLASSVGYLALLGYFHYLAVSAISVMLLIFYYNRRVAYAIFSLVLFAFFAWLWLGGSNTKAFDAVSDMIVEGGKATLFVPHDSLSELLAGGGVGSGFAVAESMYSAVFSTLGVLGAVLLLCYIVSIIVFTFRYGTNFSQVKESFYITVLAPVFAVVVLIVCGITHNVFQYDSIYCLMWILFGAASAMTKEAKYKKESLEIPLEEESLENASVVLIRK